MTTEQQKINSPAERRQAFLNYWQHYAATLAAREVPAILKFGADFAGDGWQATPYICEFTATGLTFARPAKGKGPAAFSQLLEAVPSRRALADLEPVVTVTAAELANVSLKVDATADLLVFSALGKSLNLRLGFDFKDGRHYRLQVKSVAAIPQIIAWAQAHDVQLADPTGLGQLFANSADPVAALRLEYQTE